ncbi:hypothetical protein GF380_06150 [Candidatus Uhrbacteria bacterium]|nr:hypothetical protein [Candidatus Uhrbacteria bacterium]MBD3284556.1 hypothetical protein [Candidatus Uhrbacteria bacterium]
MTDQKERDAFIRSLPLKTQGFVRPGDHEIGRTAPVEPNSTGNGRIYHVAYERPGTGQRFRILRDTARVKKY